MDNFKQASKQKLRFTTTKGSLTAEQLWDLSLTDLDTLAVSLEEAYESSKGKSFLRKRTEKNKDIKLQFDVVLDVLQTKAEEAEAAKTEKERKENNHKIMEIIQKKKGEQLEGKSLAELEAMLQ